MTDKEFGWATEYASHLQARVVESAQFVSCTVKMDSDRNCTVTVSDKTNTEDFTFTIDSDYDHSKKSILDMFKRIFKGKCPKESS